MIFANLVSFDEVIVVSGVTIKLETMSNFFNLDLKINPVFKEIPLKLLVTNSLVPNCICFNNEELLSAIPKL